MKRIIFTLLLSAAACTATFAQRFNVGIRAGANISDYAIATIADNDALLRSGKNKVGFEAALMARLSILKHFNLQAEFEYDRLGYGFNMRQGAAQRDITVKVNRIEVPLLLGVNIGPLRLFGGASFRIGHNEKSSAPSLVDVKFNDSKVAWTGGLGLNIRKFFLEGRLTGYPKGSNNLIKFQGEEYRITPRRDMKWSLSAGFLF